MWVGYAVGAAGTARQCPLASQWDSDHIYLIMEFCAGGDLSRFIRLRRILPEKVARIFLQQLGKDPLPGGFGDRAAVVSPLPRAHLPAQPAP